MSNLIKFQSSILKTDNAGRLYTPMYFDSYEDAAIFISGLNNNIELMVDLIQEGASHKTCEDVGLALKSVVKMIKQLDSLVCDEFRTFDELLDY